MSWIVSHGLILTLIIQREKKRKEGAWRRNKWDVARPQEYKVARSREKRFIVKRKREYYRQKTIDARTDINKLYVILNTLNRQSEENETAR